MKNVFDQIKRHDHRWKIEAAANVEFDRGKNRLRKLVDDVLKRVILKDELDEDFAYLMGRRIKREYELIAEEITGSKWHVLNALDESKNPADVSRVVYCWLQALRRNEYLGIARFTELVREVFDHCPSLGIRLASRQGIASLYPAGARLLDEKLVDDVIDWLRPHTKAAECFEGALRQYLSGNQDQHSDILNNLRKSLELLVKDILKNRKSL